MPPSNVTKNGIFLLLLPIPTLAHALLILFAGLSDCESIRNHLRKTQEFNPLYRR